MGKNHLKRIAAPSTWPILRKGSKFIAKSLPGPHKLEAGVPLGALLKEKLAYANTKEEVKKILHTNKVKIDGNIRKNPRFPVGVFDAIEFLGLNEYFRVILNKKGKLDLVKISKEEALLKPCRIIGKTTIAGKQQLNLYDGKNIIAESNNYGIGDTVLLLLPEHKITKHLKLDKKSTIFLIGGRHIGDMGSVEDIIENRIIYKNIKGDMIETLKRYAFVVGDAKPSVKLE